MKISGDLSLLDADRERVDALPQAYPHLVRATLLVELGRENEALVAYDAAVSAARNPAEAAEIERSRTKLETMLATRSGSSSPRR